MSRNTPGTAGLSSVSSNLIPQESEFSSSVTLYKLGNEESTLQRSPRKRVKLEVREDALDIEDIGGQGISPLLALKNRLLANANGKGKASAAASVGIKKEETKEEESALYRLESPLSSAPPSPDIASRSNSPAKKKAQKAIPTSLATPHPAPEHWEEVYGLIKDMRSRIVAPVDTMGCDQAQYKESEPKNRRFATLVSLMLSSQTKDEVTDAAMTKLRAAVGGTLSVENIVNASATAISEAIAKVGFWRRKTEYIKQTAVKLQTSFGSDVPKTVEELCSLPGVGPKMAFLALQVAWDLNLGIGVDVHVHRITNRLGWHRKPTKGPEETRLNLQSWLPKELHREINNMLVGFGQAVCLPVGPKCGECVLSGKGLCPSARVEAKKKGKKRKVEETIKIEVATENVDAD